jgi:hypothetical protein
MAYLTFKRKAPFFQSAHLTANQEILEATTGAPRVHIVHLDATHSVSGQWAPLLQAIYDRVGNSAPNLGSLLA